MHDKLFNLHVLFLSLGERGLDAAIWNDNFFEVVNGVRFDMVSLLDLGDGDIVGQGQALQGVSVYHFVDYLFRERVLGVRGLG